MRPGTAVTFEIVDLRTSDTVATYRSLTEAERAAARLIQEERADATSLAIVFFDSEGIAVGSRPATELAHA